MAKYPRIRRAARLSGLLLAGFGLAGCSGKLTPVRQEFSVQHADPASSEIVVAVVNEKCSKEHFKVEETDQAVFVYSYYTRKQRAECPDTSEVRQRTLKLKAPLGNRTIVDGIPPDPTRSPEPSLSG